MKVTSKCLVYHYTLGQLRFYTNSDLLRRSPLLGDDLAKLQTLVRVLIFNFLSKIDTYMTFSLNIKL